MSLHPYLVLNKIGDVLIFKGVCNDKDLSHPPCNAGFSST